MPNRQVPGFIGPVCVRAVRSRKQGRSWLLGRLLRMLSLQLTTVWTVNQGSSSRVTARLRARFARRERILDPACRAAQHVCRPHSKTQGGERSCKDCPPCPGGTLRKGCGGASNGYCGICSPGSFVGSDQRCADCPAGKYSAEENAGSCGACPAGKHKATAKAFFCDACEPGRFGFGYVNQTAAKYCQACPPGQIQKVSASSSCDACTAGQFQSTAGKTVCLGVQRCRKGAYLSTNATTSSDRVCTNCAAGRFADADDATVCKACAAGSFQDQTGQGACRAHRVCAAGTLVTQAPSTTVDRTCGACVVGRFAASTNSASCIECPAGKYQASSGQSVCVACVAGKIAGSGAVTSSAHCVDCISGQYQSRDGQTGCTLCAAGSYSTPGLSSCVACAPTTFQDLAGQGNCNNCQSCAGGAQRKGCGGAAKGYCGICSPGTFVTGAGACEDCSVGQYSALENAGSCVACPAGKHKATAKAFFCDVCGPGRYGSGDVNQAAGQYCLNCPPGQIQKASAKHLVQRVCWRGVPAAVG